MSESVLFQHFLRHLFPYYYVKFTGMEADFDSVESFVAKGALTENLFDVITKTIHALEQFIITSYTKCFQDLNILTIECPEEYVKYGMMFCLTYKELINDIYERFISVCALAITMGINTFHTTGRKFYKLTPRILTVFFENNLKEDFKKRGGWKRLEKYLMRQDYLEFYEALINFNRQQSKKNTSEIKEKMVNFVMRRKYMFVNQICVEGGMSNERVVALTDEVISTITELSLSSENKPASVTTLVEESIWKDLLLSTLEKIAELQWGVKCETFPPDDIETKKVAYDASLEKHLVNFKKLSRSNLGTGNSNSGESLERSVRDLYTGLENLKLKIECALSLLQSLPK